MCESAKKCIYGIVMTTKCEYKKRFRPIGLNLLPFKIILLKLIVVATTARAISTALAQRFCVNSSSNLPLKR